MKKATPKFSKNNTLTYFFVARGPGETGQARALAHYVAEKGHHVVFALHQRINYSFVQKDKTRFKIAITENPEKLKKLIEKTRPDVLLLFNSKMWGGLKDLPSSPYPESLTLCVDSNWLFNETKYPYYPFVKWAQRYFINIHPKIFSVGLKERGGHFELSNAIKPKIIPVGFIPSYRPLPRHKKEAQRKKYGIAKDEKFVFSYFSGFGAAHRAWAFENLIDAVDLLTKNGLKIKVIYTGKTEDLNPRKIARRWLILKERFDVDEYYQALASSDLVFQHQGLVTLSQAICAQVPVIANVAKLTVEPMRDLHFWEVEPFARSGVCKMLSKTTPAHVVAKKIEDLLFVPQIIQKMRRRQKELCSPGEPIVYRIIKELLQAKYEKIKNR